MTLSFADDAYRQDIIAPVRVEHRFEFGDACGEDADGAPRWGHAYNVVFYLFREAGKVAEATFDIDEGLAMLRYLHPYDVEDGFVRRVLVFLSMRAQRVALVGDGGNVVPLDDLPALAAGVAEMKFAHMRAAGD